MGQGKAIPELTRRMIERQKKTKGYSTSCRMQQKVEVVRRHPKTENGNAAWRALIACYEGLVMSGEIAKTLQTNVWNLKLQSRGDVNKHINDFTIYMDQLKELGREEREETLIDLF